MLRYTKKDFNYDVDVKRDGAYAYNSKKMKGRDIIVCPHTIYKKSQESGLRKWGNPARHNMLGDEIFDDFVENIIYYTLVERTCNATSLPYGLAGYKNELYLKCKTLCKNSEYKKGCLGCQCDMFPTYALRTDFDDVVEEVEDEWDIRWKALQKKSRENRERYNKQEIITNDDSKIDTCL